MSACPRQAPLSARQRLFRPGCLELPTSAENAVAARHISGKRYVYVAPIPRRHHARAALFWRKDRHMISLIKPSRARVR